MQNQHLFLSHYSMKILSSGNESHIVRASRKLTTMVKATPLIQYTFTFFSGRFDVWNSGIKRIKNDVGQIILKHAFVLFA